MANVISLRVKKLHLILLFALLLMVWNFITYWTLNTNNGSDGMSKEKEVAHKLEVLKREMGVQMEVHKKLLKEVIALNEKLPVSKSSRSNPEVHHQQIVQAAHQPPQPQPAEAQAKVRDPLAASPEEHIAPGPKTGILPVLMFACDRVTVSRSLDKLLQYRPSSSQFPIIVSQDCGHGPTSDVIQKYVKSHNITHIKQPDLSNINLKWPQKKFIGYYKIARHYKWALDQVFVTFGFDAVIIVEDDLEISPDFFEYFSATYPILHSDPTLWCVSAWNDNGKEGMVSNEADLLYRTDFFPGLGWMIERKLWLELRTKWPETFWDDWMRHPEQRKDRQCIRPEICRTSTFGKKGVSKGMFYEKHLKFIKLNSEAVPFTKLDLSYLQKDKYEELFVKKVYSAPLVSVQEAVANGRPEETVVRVEYTTKDTFKALAKKLGIMEDFKAGVPRAAFRGVVSFMLKGRRVFLAPPSSWKAYDTSWS